MQLQSFALQFSNSKNDLMNEFHVGFIRVYNQSNFMISVSEHLFEFGNG